MEKDTKLFEVTQSNAGKRLDKYLADHYKEKFSRAFLQKLISGRDIVVNGHPAKSHQKVSPGDVIEVRVPQALPAEIRAEAIPLAIAYEDEHLIVINKSADMVVHPAPGNYSGTLVNALLKHCANLSGIGGVCKPGIVHRIDKGTSGLLVAAKTDEAHRGLAKQFKDKTINRVYLALVKGVVEHDNGIIELPIGRSTSDRKKMAVKFEAGRDAKTQYKVIRRFKSHALLELKLGTGRTHQIRVHMSYIGHPLVGDVKYGAKGMLAHPALHAAKLGFVHPVTKRYMEFTSELPDDMNELISSGKL